MRKLLVILFITIALPVAAQEVRPARVIKKPDAAEKPEPTPAPRRSIIDRFFTREKPTPTPAPKPVAKPTTSPTKVKPKSTKPVKPATKPTSKPAKPKPAVEETPPAPAEQPASPDAPVTTPPAPVEKPPTEPAAPPKEAKVKAGGKPAKPEKPDMTGLDEAGKYKVAKEAALKEAAIIELKNKADTTIDAEAAKQATLNYNRALFKKIRAIEPSLDGYVDKLEAAVLKRVK